MPQPTGIKEFGAFSWCGQSVTCAAGDSSRVTQVPVCPTGKEEPRQLLGTAQFREAAAPL